MCRSASVSSGGGVGRVGLMIRIVCMSRRRRGEVFFIHEKVEAFFVFLLVVIVLSGRSRAARGSARVEGLIRLLETN